VSRFVFDGMFSMANLDREEMFDSVALAARVISLSFPYLFNNSSLVAPR